MKVPNIWRHFMNIQITHDIISWIIKLPLSLLQEYSNYPRRHYMNIQIICNVSMNIQIIHDVTINIQISRDVTSLIFKFSVTSLHESSKHLWRHFMNIQTTVTSLYGYSNYRDVTSWIFKLPWRHFMNNQTTHDFTSWIFKYREVTSWIFKLLVTSAMNIQITHDVNMNIQTSLHEYLNSRDVSSWIFEFPWRLFMKTWIPVTSLHEYSNYP